MRQTRVMNKIQPMERPSPFEGQVWAVEAAGIWFAARVMACCAVGAIFDYWVFDYKDSR
jgi:hypothetical protein